MTDNAGCVFSEMRGNAASYKDKKSVPAFFFCLLLSVFFSSFCLLLIGLHWGKVILHGAHSGSPCRPESKCGREEEEGEENLNGRGFGDLNPKTS